MSSGRASLRSASTSRTRPADAVRAALARRGFALGPSGSVASVALGEADAVGYRGGLPVVARAEAELGHAIPPAAVPAAAAGPELLGSVLEHSRHRAERRARGAFFTPPAVARLLTARVCSGVDPATATVCDPAVGG